MDSITGANTPNEKGVMLVKKYPAEMPAFELGLVLCNFFEEYKPDRRQPFTVPDIPFDYFDAICYLMRFKNISPHAMGTIYRSLYIRQGRARAFSDAPPATPADANHSESGDYIYAAAKQAAGKAAAQAVRRAFSSGMRGQAAPREKQEANFLRRRI